jgi:ketosteroid isomerase-like protein
MNKSEQIWGAYMQSMQQQTEDWKALLADDITFTGPAAKAVGKAEYIKTTESFCQMVRGGGLKRHVANETVVATEIEVKMATPSGKEIVLDMSEFYEIRNGKIQSVRVYYDAQEFRKEFGLG